MVVRNKNLNVVHTIKFHLLATFTAKDISCGHGERFLVGMKCGRHFWLCTFYKHTSTCDQPCGELNKEHLKKCALHISSIRKTETKTQPSPQIFTK